MDDTTTGLSPKQVNCTNRPAPTRCRGANNPAPSKCGWPQTCL